MKQIPLFLVFFFAMHIYAQKVTYTGIILVDSFPEEMLPVGASEVGFITAGEKNQPVGWGYEISELNYKIIAKFGKEYDNYEGVEPKAFYRNDTMFFWSHVKYKDVQTYNYYSWDSKKLSFLSTETIDPSKTAAAAGDAALRKREVRLASEEYNKVKYVPVATLAKTAFNILGVGHYLALEAFYGNSFKEAVEYMDGAFVYFVNDTLLKSEDEFAFNKVAMSYFDSKQIDSIGPWLTHYALFLYKADSLERTLTLSSFVTMCYPKMPDAYLIKADALYDLKQEEEAKPYYDKYLGLMTVKGNAAQVPPRVTERLSAKPKVKTNEDD